MAKNGNYIEVYPESGKRLYEHRAIAEKVLGRSLKESEVVHHVDRTGSNNSPSNLWVFRTNADHSRFHKTGVAILQDDGTYIGGKRQPKNKCIACGELCFRKFCSPRCSAVGHRKANRPTKEELWKMVQETSFVAVGRRFGVTDNAIRNWLGIKK